MDAHPRQRWAVAGILMSLFLGAIDATVVGPSMPSIVAELKRIDIYYLVFSVFMLTHVVSVPIYGRLSDMYGRRWFHLLSLSIFIGASMLCGLSRSMEMLIVFRGVQGIGAGGLMSLSFTMIGDLYPLEQRGKIQGAIGGVWGLASLVGPIVGGLITKYWGWKWIFFVNAPFGILAAVLVQSSWVEPPRHEGQKPDIPGAILVALAAGALMTTCAVAGRLAAWSSPLILGLLGVTVLCVALLVVMERRVAHPFLQYDLYKIPLFATGALTGVFATTCLFGTTSYVPLFIQGVVGEDATWAGLVLVPMMIPWVICSGAAGHLILRFGYRVLSILGMALAAVAYVLLARLGGDATWRQAAFAMLFMGAGLGLTVTPLLIAAQNSVPRERMGASTSLTQFSRTMGGAIGVAVMGVILSTTLVSRLSALPGAPDPNQIVDRLARQRLTPQQLEMGRAPLAEGLRRIFIFGAIAGGVGLLMALAIPRGKARDLAHQMEVRGAAVADAASARLDAKAPDPNPVKEP